LILSSLTGLDVFVLQIFPGSNLPGYSLLSLTGHKMDNRPRGRRRTARQFIAGFGIISNIQVPAGRRRTARQFIAGFGITNNNQVP